MEKEKTILSKSETSPELVQTIQFVEDNRPASLKSLDKTVIDKTVKSLGEYELKRKKQNKPLPYQHNVDATKYYFATRGETLARVMIVFAQLLLIVVSLIYISTLSQVLAQFLMSLVSKLNTSFTGPIVAIGQPIVLALIILLSISWVATFFFLTIPILIAQTFRIVHIWTIVVSIVGNINCLIVFLIAVLQILYVKGSAVGLNINPFILPGIILACFVCFTIGCMALQNNRKKYQRKVENELANQIRATRGQGEIRMLTKISSKRDELALQWNTRVEVAARLLIIGFSILGTFMGYFISAGCAMAYNNIKNLTGVISHRTYEIHYIIAGVAGLVCAFFFFCFIGLPYLKLKRAASFKSWIIISTVFAIVYYVVCFVLGVTYIGMFNTINNYFIVTFTLISVCILVIFPSYVLLWREVKKQWVLRKQFEYLADEEQMKKVETKLVTLEQERQHLVELETIKYNKEKYNLNNLKEKKQRIYVQKPVLEQQEKKLETKSKELKEK